LRPGWARRVRCSRSRSCPAPCRLPRAEASLVKGRLVASGYPRACPSRLEARERLGARRACAEKDASLRLLQPTYDHVHPARTIRFPSAPAPLAGALAGPCSGTPLRDASAIPCGIALQGFHPFGTRPPELSLLRTPSAAGAGPPSVVGPPANPTRVERRLTATLQLRPSSTTRPAVRAEPKLRRSCGEGAPRGPGGAAIGSSSALRLPAAALSAANRARDVTSGALCRDPAPLPRPSTCCHVEGPGPRRRAARPALPSPPRQGRRWVPDQDAFHRRGPPPRCPRWWPRSCLRGPWDRHHGEPALPPGIAAVRTRRFAAACMRPAPASPATSPPRAGYGASSPLCAKQIAPLRKAEPRREVTLPCVRLGARPMPEGVDPAPLVDFCNQNSPRAQPPISRSLAAAPGGYPPCAANQVAPPPRSLVRRSPCEPTRPLRAFASEWDPCGPSPSAPRDLQAGRRALAQRAPLAGCPMRASTTTPTEFSRVRGHPGRPADDAGAGG